MKRGIFPDEQRKIPDEYSPETLVVINPQYIHTEIEEKKEYRMPEKIFPDFSVSAEKQISLEFNHQFNFRKYQLSGLVH